MEDKIESNGHAPGGLSFLTLDEQIPETKYLDEPIIPEGAFVFFVGAEGSSKTIVARWIALRVASQGRRVLYLSEDNPKVKDHQFLARMLAGMGMDRSLPEALKFAHSQGVDLSERYWRDRVVAEVEEFEPALIVVDGYTTIFGGGMAAQYESWDTAAAYSTFLKKVRPICDSSVVTICHGPNTAPTKLPGGSALRGVADLTVAFAGTYRGGEVSRFTVESTKGTRYRSFAFAGTVTGPEDDRSPLLVELKGDGMARGLRYTRTIGFVPAGEIRPTQCTNCGAPLGERNRSGWCRRCYQRWWVKSDRAVRSQLST